MIQTFLPVYAALRLTGPPKRTITGLVVQGLILLVLAPFVVFALVLASLLRLIVTEARQPVAKPPPFDYAAWQLDAARAKVARNQEAYRRREANKPQGFAGHVAELRNQQGEAP
jgi:hypothetical protein